MPKLKQISEEDFFSETKSPFAKGKEISSEEFFEDVQETIPQKIGRRGAALGARALEATGAPIDLLKGLISGGLQIAEKEVPEFAPSLGISQKATAPSFEGKAEELAETITEQFPEFIKGREELREVTKEATGGYLEPRSGWEETQDEFVDDVVSLMLPGGPQKLGRALYTAIAGQAGKYVSKKLGAGKSGQEFGKLGGIMLASALGTRQKIKEEMTKDYERARELIPENARVTDKKLENFINKTQRRVNYQPTKTQADWREIVGKQLQDIDKDISLGRVDVQNLWDKKLDINKFLREGRVAGKPLGKEARKFLGNIVGEINQTLETYGKENPSFYKAFSEAEEVFKGLNARGFIDEFINKNINKSRTLQKTLKNPLTKILIYGIPGGILKSPKIAGMGAAVGIGHAGLRELNKLRKLVLNSPKAMKAYQDAIMGGIKKNWGVFSKNARKLDKIISQ